MHSLFDFEPGEKKERGAGQKTTLTIAYICYLCAVICVAICVYTGMQDTTSPVFASALATTVFFLCVGIVLQVLGTGNLPSLKVEDNPDQPVPHPSEKAAAENQTAEQASNSKA